MNLIAANYKLLKNAQGPIPTPGYNTNEYVSRVSKSWKTKRWRSEGVKTLGMAVQIKKSVCSEAKDGSVEQVQACTRTPLRSEPFTNIDARNR